MTPATAMAVRARYDNMVTVVARVVKISKMIRCVECFLLMVFLRQQTSKERELALYRFKRRLANPPLTGIQNLPCWLGFIRPTCHSNRAVTRAYPHAGIITKPMPKGFKNLDPAREPTCRRQMPNLYSRHRLLYQRQPPSRANRRNENDAVGVGVATPQNAGPSVANLSATSLAYNYPVHEDTSDGICR